jgi:hypothetical protein
MALLTPPPPPELRHKKGKTVGNTTINYVISSLNGGPIKEEAQEVIEGYIERALTELFNNGHRCIYSVIKE